MPSWVLVVSACKIKTLSLSEFKLDVVSVSCTCYRCRIQDTFTRKEQSWIAIQPPRSLSPCRFVYRSFLLYQKGHLLYQTGACFRWQDQRSRLLQAWSSKSCTHWDLRYFYKKRAKLNRGATPKSKSLSPSDRWKEPLILFIQCHHCTTEAQWELIISWSSKQKTWKP